MFRAESTSFKMGINYFDTASAYEDSEAIVSETPFNDIDIDTRIP